MVGPTASGKSAVALDVARRLRAGGGPGVELVSIDSMAVYRGMDIGTAKPTGEVRAEVPFHLVDLVDPWEEFTVQQFQVAARDALAGVASRDHGALLVGGTGLYLRAVVDDLVFPGRYPEVAAELTRSLDEAGGGDDPRYRSALAALHRRLAVLDPLAAARVDPSNRRRLVRALEVTIGSGRPFSSYGPGLERYLRTAVALVGIRVDPATLDRRIAERFARLMDEGLLEEVRGLAAAPGGLSRTARQALGYREILSHLEDAVPLDLAVERAVQRTRAFARRQMAWFRRDPRIAWVEPDDDPAGTISSLLHPAHHEASTVGDWSTPS
ncbi:MAG: tRNA (adenosine(37)-N6)-dimethylallyltransferase MiaA [Acidimicrobiales bacterium]